MTNKPETRHHRSLLQDIARRAMLDRGLLPDFSAAALAELAKLPALERADNGQSRDLRHLPWCSIDNDDSRDLDQLTVAADSADERTKILVAVADVDALVKKGSAIDDHARRNTTSVYTPARIFPMLPEKLSTDLTSLNFASERYAMVVEMDIDGDGALQGSAVYRALVRNHAKLAYNGVAAWLDGNSPMPDGIEAVEGLETNLRLQDRTAQRMKEFRHEQGALTLETVEARIAFDDGHLKDLEAEQHNRAKALIEDFMIGANGVVARFLASQGFPSLRRVVRTPKRWDRIVELAAEHGFALPEIPSAKALEKFLSLARSTDPLRFPDLSLSVIKLLGKGEYVVESREGDTSGHFGLAVQDYAHSTAPNRRYPDVITQRLLKAAIAGGRLPYDRGELADLARLCTEKEDAAKKVERRVRKSAEALLLEPRLGERFDAIVTGAAEKGTWVRLLHPPVEGRLMSGFEGADVGHLLRVRLVRTDVQNGFIDFERVQQ
jgi:VacB/RNase II family 3'-5' exoribonuclease